MLDLDNVLRGESIFVSIPKSKFHCYSEEAFTARSIHVYGRSDHKTPQRRRKGSVRHEYNHQPPQLSDTAQLPLQ